MDPITDIEVRRPGMCTERNFNDLYEGDEHKETPNKLMIRQLVMGNTGKQTHNNIII